MGAVKECRFYDRATGECGLKTAADTIANQQDVCRQEGWSEEELRPYIQVADGEVKLFVNLDNTCRGRNATERVLSGCPGYQPKPKWVSHTIQSVPKE